MGFKKNLSIFLTFSSGLGGVRHKVWGLRFGGLLIVIKSLSMFLTFGSGLGGLGDRVWGLRFGGWLKGV